MTQPLAGALVLAAALDQSQDAVLLTDAGGDSAQEKGMPEPRIVYVNAAFTRLTGYTLADLLGQPLRVLQGPGNTRTTLDRLSNSLRQGAGVQANLLNRRKDGSVYWADLTLSPVTDEGGALTHWVAVQREVTARRQFTANLQTAQAQVWELAINHAPLEDVLAKLLTTVEQQFGGARAVIVLPGQHQHSLTVAAEPKGSEVPPGPHAQLSPWDQAITDRSGALLGRLQIQSQEDRLPDADERAGLEAAAGLAALVMQSWASQAELERRSLHDALTSLPNRVLFERELERLLAHGDPDQLIAVGLMDLDRFKLINDTLGHSVGDALLQQVAIRLRGALRRDELLARMGGDEFLLLLDQAATPQAVQQVAERLLHTFSQPFLLAGREIFMQLSLGFSILPRHGARAELLMQRADTAMYQAKRQGGGYALYRPDSEEPLLAMTLESGLHRALERQEFTIQYQPQLDTRTGQLVGVEALLRWQHPELGLILPGEFIPLAEVTGLIVPIGAWVLRQACEQAAQWVIRMPQLRLAVNLSARQFQQPDLMETVMWALESAGLAPWHLELELTESMLVQVQDAEATLQALKRLGVRIVIDDFGTGYSNLSYLKHYSVDALKINATFIAEVGGHAVSSMRDEVLVKAVMNLAYALDLAVTAEGVERPEQLEFLRRHNCDAVQGFLLGPPQKAAVLMETFPQLAPSPPA
ncbi:bifunctional diguanylate cyclase/phosphodiesterase [Deinococcus sp. QL22]|uniref:putative bifunctional diguanylate cyclase/phosphodiesterase n=1 Tax=Deinococcus sp. QL22 TaxID=2939437 RepID=UPI002016E354|nr:GGDEF and EAL domain-containing protein [Deinococcus sp. QL22]UQN09816.1 EAL domain-containing protein [Deinococcus sp. QL22]